MSDQTYFGFQAKAWEDNNYQGSSVRVKTYLKREQLAIRLIGEEKNVLELGCGTGHLTRKLSDLGKKVHAIDVEPEMIKHAEIMNKGTAKFEVQSVENLKFKQNSFDSVVGLGVLPYVDEKRALKQIHRVLKKNGTLVVSFGIRGPHSISRNLFSKLPFKGKSLLLSGTQTESHKENEIIKMLQESDFKVIETVKFGRKFFPFHLILGPLYNLIENTRGFDWLDSEIIIRARKK